MRVLIFLACGLLPALALAQASVGRERFEAAIRLEESGRYREAVDALRDGADADPTGAFAAPSLQRAGRILAVRLFDFDAALEVLERVQREYPTHPKALAARGLADRISRGRAQGDEPLRIFLTLRERPDLIEGEDPVEILQALLREHRDFPYRAEVLLDLGVRLRREGRDDEAVQVFQQARTEQPKSRLAGRATLEIAEGYFARGEYLEAASWFDRVGASGGSALLGRENAERARSHHQRRRIERWSFFVLGLFGLWTTARTRWSEVRLPAIGNSLRELAVLAPAALLIVLFGPPTSPVIRHPIYWICGGTALLLLLSNLSLSTRPPGPRARRVHVLLTLTGILAMSYVILHRYDLIFALEDAFDFRPADA